MYQIEFEQMNNDRNKWQKEVLDNDGQGFTVIDVKLIANELADRDDCRNVKIVEMEG